MDRTTAPSWYGSLLLIVVMILGSPSAALPDEKKSRAHSAPAENQIAQQFGTVTVQTSITDPGHLLTVTDVRALRDKGLGYSDITTLIQLYANQSGSQFRSFDNILALRQAKDGRSWNQVAKTMGYESLAALKRALGQTGGNDDDGEKVGKKREGRDEKKGRAHSARKENQIAEQFGTVTVQTSITDPGHLLTVTDVRALRNKGLSYGNITTLVLLYANQSGSTFRSFDNILAIKQAQDGRSWNRVAKIMGFESLRALKKELGLTGGNQKGEKGKEKVEKKRENGERSSAQVEKKREKGERSSARVEKKRESGERSSARVEKVEKKPERRSLGRVDKVEKKPQRLERREQVQKAERREQVQRPERREQVQRPERREQVQRPERREQVQRAERREQIQRAERREQD